VPKENCCDFSGFRFALLSRRTFHWSVQASMLPSKSTQKGSVLDPELVGEVLRVMRSVAEDGRTMIVVTHEMSLAREVSNHLVFLHQGRLEEEGDPRQVLARPQSERLQGFLANSLKG
jgi:ABC-type histidine transport system ATPase subunit